MEARLAREATVLVEKDEGVNNILMQLGRDTAIIEAHKFMMSQQQYKVAQIQQVWAMRSQFKHCDYSPWSPQDFSHHFCIFSVVCSQNLRFQIYLLFCANFCHLDQSPRSRHSHNWKYSGRGSRLTPRTSRWRLRTPSTNWQVTVSLSWDLSINLTLILKISSWQWSCSVSDIQ